MALEFASLVTTSITEILLSARLWPWLRCEAELLTSCLIAGFDVKHHPGISKWSLPDLDKFAAQDQEDMGMATRTSVCVIHLQQAVGKSELTDVQILVGDEWVASAHRSMLSARSPVLAKMLANQTEDKRKGVIKLDDVTAETLLLFLEFIYLGKNLFQEPFLHSKLIIAIAVELQWRGIHRKGERGGKRETWGGRRGGSYSCSSH